MSKINWGGILAVVLVLLYVVYSSYAAYEKNKTIKDQQQIINTTKIQLELVREEYSNYKENLFSAGNITEVIEKTTPYCTMEVKGEAKMSFFIRSWWHCDLLKDSCLNSTDRYNVTCMWFDKDNWCTCFTNQLANGTMFDRVYNTTEVNKMYVDANNESVTNMSGY